MKLARTTFRISILAVMLVALMSACTYVPPEEDSYEDDIYGVDFHQGPPDDEFGDLWYWGNWLAVEPYGWAWQPYVIEQWRPFEHGQWLFTEFGWTWISYEPFGWAVYHYGHWMYDRTWGWLWVPGFEWYPATVEWMVYDRYVAWAPLGPRGYNYYDPWAFDERDAWTVVDGEHFTSTDVGRFRQKAPRFNWAPSRDEVVKEQPDVEIIEQMTHNHIEPVEVEMTAVEGTSKKYQRMKLPPKQSKTVAHYRPRVEKKILKKEERRKRPPDERAQPEDQRQQEESTTEKKKTSKSRDTRTKEDA